MSDKSAEANEVYDIELDYTPIIIGIVLIAVILLLLWFFSRTDVSYSPVASSSTPTAYDISTAFNIVS
jgi:hypothetical protein